MNQRVYCLYSRVGNEVCKIGDWREKERKEKGTKSTPTSATQFLKFAQIIFLYSGLQGGQHRLREEHSLYREERSSEKDTGSEKNIVQRRSQAQRRTQFYREERSSEKNTVLALIFEYCWSSDLLRVKCHSTANQDSITPTRARTVVMRSISMRPVRGLVAAFCVDTFINLIASSTSATETVRDNRIFAKPSERRIRLSNWRGVADIYIHTRRKQWEAVARE